MARIFTLHAAPLALFGAVLAQPAQAAAAGVMTIPLAVTSAFAAGEACPAGPVPTLALASATTSPAGMPSKASALLGGRVSQLDLMRQQQGLQSPQISSQVADYGAIAALQPGEGPLTLGTAPSNCGATFGFAVHAIPAVPQFGTAPLNPVLSGSGDFLASKRIAIGHTRFDSEWNHVRSSGLSRRALRAVPLEEGPASTATLTAVNSWANASIHYVEDQQLYGEADHWATAGETMRLREGDCEDIAIVKMQLLAARGIKREDMSLVIARDQVRGADHALLVVKLDGQMWLLDNSTDQVLDATQSYDYRPILSFSAGKKWIHGY
jgi:predicted transglutaminase-like cysteine proteinase